jgi:hypothetical protein
MIGLSMGLAMVVGVAAFSVIYSVLDPLTDDFVTKSNNTLTARQAPVDEEQNASGDTGQTGSSDDPVEEVSFMSASGPTVPAADIQRAVPTPTPVDEFDPDYRISSRRNINFRAGPGTSYEVVVVLAPGQPLEATGETAPTSNPARDGLPSGGLWRQFRTEDGEEGWIRDVDVDPLNR